MSLSVLILGSGSALPTISSNQTSQLVFCDNQSFLVDCGEGTQVELRRNKVRIQDIDYIFISHLHGDHFFGLIGLLSTMHLLGRKKELYLFGPKGLDEILQLQFKNAGSHLSYAIKFTLVHKEGEVLFENSKVVVTTIPMNHRIPCYGYKFQEKIKPRRFKNGVIEKYEIPIHARRNITEGADFITNEGLTIKNTELTNDPPKTKSYAFCSDTAYYERIIPFIKDVDLLYHEATFLEQDNDRAGKTFHSTAKQAANIALKAGAKQLILGHFSNRYKNKDAFLHESRQIFKESYIAEEGKYFQVGN